MGVTDLTQGFDQSTFFRNDDIARYNQNQARKTGTSIDK